MRTLASSASAGNDVVVDSCGTGGGSESWYFEGGFSHHEGDPSDARMRAAASERGIAIESVSRPLRPDDFDNFDYIVAMDEMNIEAIDDARRHWGVPDSDARVVLLSEYSGDETFRGRPVPDPYWSGAKGFELALDLIEESCKGLLDEILAERSGAGGEAQ